jgi:uncharacterized SAM-binding protein YcdF (DUF218 family)
MKKQNFIVISTLDWKANWQIPHELVNSLLQNNNRVLYVENTGVRSFMFKDFNRIFKRGFNFLNSAKGFKNETKNFSLFSPVIFPYPYSKLALNINKLIYVKNIKKWIEINNLEDAILICFLPSPINIELIKDINFKKIIYYCLDNLSKGYLDSSKIKNFEKKFLKLSDINFFTSENLLKKNYIPNKSLLLPAGVKLENFTKKRKIKKIKRIIGYIGAVSDVFDQELMIKIAKEFKTFQIIIVGPVVTNIDRLIKYKNIKFINQVGHKFLQNYMINFDVGVIPYRINSFTQSVYPCKLNEYLALGLPVVTTNLSELQKKNVFKSDTFSIAKNHKDFIEKIKKELKNDNSDKIKRRKNYALNNSWNSRYQKFNDSINSIIRTDYKDNSWKDLFIDQINLFKKKTYIILSTTVLAYLLVFHSSLIWYAGDYLRYFQNIEKSDILVVFSGDGKDSYINNSYQERVLDAISYHKLKYYKKIYLSSGKEQTIPETIIIKSLLKNYGIKENQITIQYNYPSSTAENIAYVYKELKKNNVTKTLFLTSPFHSRRSMLIWKKYKDIKVIPIKPTRDDYKNQKYNLKLKSLKVIVYEYLSILYNYLKGNIF